METQENVNSATDTLGILVTSDKHLGYVISLTDAAHDKGKTVEIFFTGKSVLLTQLADFAKLVGKARISVCEASFRNQGLKGEVPGVGFENFETQARNADLMENCNKYVVF